ncbi:MAG: Mth938-like domain-containing protein [Halothiobacillus sp.]
MRLNLDDSGQRFVVRGFTETAVRINQDEISISFLLTPEQLIERVPLHTVAALQAGELNWLYTDAPEVLIIGTGLRTVRAQPAVQAELLRAGVGVEFMDTGAACRTYTVLASELRRVSLLVLFPEETRLNN